ncbi:MAG TPA: YdhR family protein [Ilumatobacteraceae bacterium]|nr:YdhR family protein [Ilumatobacteraceae bacterium]
MIVAVVNFDLPAPLAPDEARAMFEASAPNYQNVDGLRRKHYLLSDDGRTAGGVYLWDSRQQAEALYDEEWRARLTARYGSPPRVTYYESQVTVDPTSITVG